MWVGSGLMSGASNLPDCSARVGDTQLPDAIVIWWSPSGR
jgi:hypothetical protein